MRKSKVLSYLILMMFYASILHAEYWIWGVKDIDFEGYGLMDNTYKLSAPYVDVRAYAPAGTLRDGIVDWTAYIQAAVDAIASTNNQGGFSGTVLFPAGIYLTTAPILVESSNTELLGVGSNQVYIKVNHDNSAFVFGKSGFNKVNFKISGMKMEKVSHNTAGSIGIRAIQPWGLIVENCQIDWFYYGVYADAESGFAGADLNIQNNRFNGNIKDIAANTYGYSNSSSANNTFSGPSGSPHSGGIGIDLTQGFNAYTSYNDKFDSYETGIKVSGNNQHIFRPRFDSAGTYGVFIVDNASTVSPVVFGIAAAGPTYALYDNGAKCKICIWETSSSGGNASRITPLRPFIIEMRGYTTSADGISFIAAENSYNEYAGYIVAGADNTTSSYLLLQSLAGSGGTRIDNLKLYSGSTRIKTALFTDVSAYDNNAAAVADGLAVGRIYRTGDALKVVHE